jgi:cytochrome P450
MMPIGIGFNSCPLEQVRENNAFQLLLQPVSSCFGDRLESQSFCLIIYLIACELTGPRMCLGSIFAQMSVALIVATLEQHFRFRAVAPTAKAIPATYDITLSFKSTDGLRMAVTSRS